MTEISRRKFLLMSGAAAALVAAPISALGGSRTAPVLYGDGSHDDTDALQAWFDGKPVKWAYGGAPVHPNFIEGRTFRLSRAINGEVWLRRAKNSRAVFSFSRNSLMWTDNASSGFRWLHV